MLLAFNLSTVILLVVCLMWHIIVKSSFANWGVNLLGKMTGLRGPRSVLVGKYPHSVITFRLIFNLSTNSIKGGD